MRIGVLGGSGRRVGVTGVMAALPLMLLAACGEPSPGSGSLTVPGRVEAINGGEVKKVVLSERALEQIGLQTAPVSRDVRSRDRVERRAVPYSSLLYRSDGTTVVYTNPAPLVYVAQPVEVESIQGDRVTFAVGPPPGVRVVSVGASELLGIELSVEK